MMIARQFGRRTALALSAALFVSACGEDDVVVEPETGDERLASGEVLDGTITDAMIPLDQLQSQAPPLRVAPNDNGANASDDSDGDEGAGEAPSIEAEPVIDLAPPADPAPIAPAPE